MSIDLEGRRGASGAHGDLGRWKGVGRVFGGWKGVTVIFGGYFKCVCVPSLCVGAPTRVPFGNSSETF